MPHRSSLGLLKDIAAKAIASGELPTIHASHYFTGKGNGENCPLCQVPIPVGEKSATFDEPNIVRKMHIRCFRSWQEAVDNPTRVAILERRARKRP
jgi:hypothetical protein